MDREIDDYLQDIVDAMDKAQQFIENLSFEDFVKDNKTVFAVVRALEIVGEATKNIPDNYRVNNQNIPWKDMAGMRDILIHGYFGVDMETIWLTVTEKIPKIKPLIRNMLNNI